jgi:hypothetical protein
MVLGPSAFSGTHLILAPGLRSEQAALRNISASSANSLAAQLLSRGLDNK